MTEKIFGYFTCGLSKYNKDRVFVNFSIRILAMHSCNDETPLNGEESGQRMAHFFAIEPSQRSFKQHRWQNWHATDAISTNSPKMPERKVTPLSEKGWPIYILIQGDYFQMDFRNQGNRSNSLYIVYTQIYIYIYLQH